MRANLKDIEDRRFDLIVIGGGINGAGIARDAAMRGLKVLLLDKGDVASGTTSWSTRLIHGGLRYLEHGEIRLVRESLHEREHLLKIAPHLVRPLPLLIPIYKQNRRGRLTIKAGMLAYDLLSIGKSLDRHRMLSPDEARDVAPGLERSGLAGAAMYYDAQIEYAERLVLENVLAAADHGGEVITYGRVDELLSEDNRVLGVRCTDLVDGGSFCAYGSLTVNAAGPWVDDVFRRAGCALTQQIGATKGSHMVVAHFPGAPRSGLYVEASEDGRPFFIIPWNDLFLIGTTDIPYDGDLDHVKADDAEVAYLLRETSRVIPSAGLDERSILYTYAGIRPLPFVPAGDPSSITRRHFIRDYAPNLTNVLSIVGGKLTTYRSLAEEAVDRIFRQLGKPSVPCRTSGTKLPGAAGGDLDSFRTQFQIKSGLSKNAADRLVRIYGTRADDVLALAGGDPALLAPIASGSHAIAAEVVFSFQREFACTLTDCLMRRTMIGWDADLGLGTVEGAASVAQRFLGWDKERVSGEIQAYRTYVERFHPRRFMQR